VNKGAGSCSARRSTLSGRDPVMSDVELAALQALPGGGEPVWPASGTQTKKG
jgi:hypothetical protein